MREVWQLLLTLVVVRHISARVRTSGRLISHPRVDKCSNRPKHFMDKRTGHYYFFSGMSHFRSYKATWLDSRNICREMCMDLISIETPEENMMVKSIMLKGDVEAVWTSGRLCNFHGCEQPHLKPKHINGWFWSGSGVRISPTNETALGWPSNPWSNTGFLSQFVEHLVPQPDNAEFLLHGSGVTVEACLAVHNSWYGDGVGWHDTACYRTKQFICEDSEKMMNLLKHKYPQTRV